MKKSINSKMILSALAILAIFGSGYVVFNSSGFISKDTGYQLAAPGGKGGGGSSGGGGSTSGLVAPSNLTSVLSDDSIAVNLIWSDTNTSESGFYVERGVQTGYDFVTGNPSYSFSVIGTTGSNVLSYTDPSAPASTTLYYRVRAYISAKKGTTYSAYSNVATTTTLPDTTIPSVHITSPVSGATYTSNQTLNVSASAYDNSSIAKVEFYDGDLLKSTSYVAPYSSSWTISAAYNGSRTIRVKAYDGSGNVAIDSVPISVNIAPNLSQTDSSHDWPQRGHDSAKTYSSPDAVGTGLSVKWSWNATTNPDLYTSNTTGAVNNLIEYQGKIFTNVEAINCQEGWSSCMTPYVQVLDALTGGVSGVWHYNYDATISTLFHLAAGGGDFVISSDGLNIVSASTYKKVGQGGKVNGEAQMIETLGEAIVDAPNNRFFAINTKQFHPKFNGNLPQGYIGSFELSTGNPVWIENLHTGASDNMSMAYGNGIVYVAADYGTSTAWDGSLPPKNGLYALDASTGKQLWFVPSDVGHAFVGHDDGGVFTSGGVTLDSSNAYVTDYTLGRHWAFSDPYSISAYNAQTGKLVWKTLTNGTGGRVIANAGNIVIWGGVAYNKSDGSVAWTSDFSTTYLNSNNSPAVAISTGSGLIYTTSMSSPYCEIAAYSLSTGQRVWTSSDVNNVAPCVNPQLRELIIENGNLIVTGPNQVIMLGK